MRTRLVVLLLLVLECGVLSAQPPAPVTNPQMALLQVVVTSPTTATTYDAGTSDTLTTLSGTATGSHPILTCTWSNSLGGSGTTTGTTSWSITSVALTVGSNVITVTCLTDQGLSRSDVVTVTRSAVTTNPIATTRRTDWSTVGATITHRTTQCGSTIAAYTGTAGTINNAIDACPDNQFVLLGCGTFNLSTGLDFDQSNVTLRGCTGGVSKLVIGGAVGNCHLFYNSAVQMCSHGTNIGTDNTYANSANWTAGYAKGSTDVTLANVTGLTVGTSLFVDQLNDSSDGYPAAGDIFICESGPPACSNQGGNSWARSGRVQTEVHIVTAINGTVVTIDPPIHANNWRSGQDPEAWWTSGVEIENSGIEDLTIQWTATDHPAIQMVNVQNVWLRNLRIIRAGNSGQFVMHVVPVNAFRVTVRDSYFYGPAAAGATNNTNYALTAQVAGSNLYENNIFHHPISAMVPNDPEMGSVYAYNYVDDLWYAGAWLDHSAASQFLLIEGNDLCNIEGDILHGPHYFHTFFRNYLSRLSHCQSQAAYDAGFVMLTRNRFMNSVGNVYGNTGWTTYESTTADNDALIYQIGDKGSGSMGDVVDDTHVSRTLFRWGDWNSVTSSDDNGTCDTTGSRFESSEVPSGITNYPNTVPSSQTLPSSMYLSAEPSFFGSVAWPPIGPDVCNSNITTTTGGHANRIPARVCFETLTNDSDYPSSSPRIRNFDARTCYPIP